jgi:hypothetical protein
MRRTRFVRAALIAALALSAAADSALAQGGDADLPVRFKEQNLSGPRLGVTMVTGNGELWQSLDEQGMGRTLSQFGWQFEHRIVPIGGGPKFVIEFVPLVAGVEYGKLVPSATLAMGVRFPSGIEFGIGPNAAVVGGDKGVMSALVVALGKTFDYGGVSLPVNVTMGSNPDGQRFSLIVGYAIQHASAAPRTGTLP